MRNGPPGTPRDVAQFISSVYFLIHHMILIGFFISLMHSTKNMKNFSTFELFVKTVLILVGTFSGRDQLDPCAPGHYCPLGTGTTAPECPPGTFAENEGTPNETSCEPCSAGEIFKALVLWLK